MTYAMWLRRRAPRLLTLFFCLIPALVHPVETHAHSREYKLKVPGQHQIQTEKFLLTLGQTAVRELNVGASHSYHVTLAAGQFIRVTVEQNGTDVTLALFGPDERQLFMLDSPNGTHGKEALWFVAELPGSYRIEIAAGEREASSSRYTIRLDEARAATDLDRRKVAGQQLWADGQLLRLERTGAARRTMLEKFQQALVIFQEVGERQSEANALYEIGFQQWALNEFQQSIVNYTKAAALHESLGDPSAQAYALNGIGNNYDYMGDKETALEFYQRSLALHRAVGNGQGEAQSLNGIGVVYKQFGAWHQSVFYLSQARALYSAAGNSVAEAVAFNNLGQAYGHLGDYQQALELFEKSLVLRGTKNPRGRANTLNSIGGIYVEIGDSQKALDHYQRAIPLWREASDHRGEANTLVNLAAIYRSSGERTRVLEVYQHALRIYRDIGDRFGEAVVIDSLGQIALETQDYEQAITSLSAALALRRAIKDRNGEAQTLRHLAETRLALNQTSEARQHIEAALGIVENLRAGILGQELRASYLATAQHYYEFYIDLLMFMHRKEPSAGYDALALRASEQAHARSLLDLLQEARLDIHKGVIPALQKRERLLSDQLSLLADRQTQLLRGQYKPEQAAAFAQEIETLAVERSRVWEEIRLTSERYVALTEPRILGLKEIQQETLDSETVLLEYKLGEQRSHLWAVTSTSIHSFELPKRSEIENAARRVYQLLTARNDHPSGESLSQRQTRIAQAEKEYSTAAVELSRILLVPAASSLNHKRIVVVGDGALLYIPLAALPDPAAINREPGEQQPLMVGHEVVNLPSASIIVALRRDHGARASARKAVAVLADPVFDNLDSRVKTDSALKTQSQPFTTKRAVSTRSVPDDTGFLRAVQQVGQGEEQKLPRLSFSRREAEAIMATTSTRQGMVALDFQANRETAMSDTLASYRLVHFATHGILNSRSPELSGLVFSLVDKQGRQQNGYLRLQDVYNLNLPVEMVVLSACQTALGKEINGEGLIGLTRGFMYAGAARVTASLWQVDDSATSKLMGHFYHAMLQKRMTPAAALRAAQIHMWEQKRWQSPYYWAGFVLQGDWK